MPPPPAGPPVGPDGDGAVTPPVPSSGGFWPFQLSGMTAWASAGQYTMGTWIPAALASSLTMAIDLSSGIFAKTR